jgi:hypothetical protein
MDFNEYYWVGMRRHRPSFNVSEFVPAKELFGK